MAHAHRQFREGRRVSALTDEAVTKRSQGGEEGPRLLGIVERGRQQHQPLEANGFTGGRGVQHRSEFPGIDSVFRRLFREVDLDEDLERPAPTRRRLVDLLQQRTRVNRPNRIESYRLFRFVRLQVADEMPAKRKIRGGRDFRESLLDLVFAEIDLSGLCGRTNVARRKGFGNGDELDGGWIALRPAGSARDAFANV